ncbi:MAG: phosphate starvation-inducible protein PsiF [Ramlibacter sp.]|nr:phosphate starvation-inducible protein PsiF [Ramlibacter sp.]
MKQLISVIVLGAGLVCSSAYAAKAAEPAPAAAKIKTKQQVKMANCNKDAKEKALKGGERKKFMSTCLSA